MKIVISIPVHEKPDVIIDQISNIKKYINNPIIVLHISKSFFDNYSLELLINITNVYINPEHLETAWGNILLTHVSNYFFIKNIVEFDYFLIQASNDMFVKKGIEDYIKNYKAGFCRRVISQKISMWWPACVAWDDKQLKRIMNFIGQSRIVATQIEGTFFKRSIADKVMNVIKDNYVIDQGNEAYPREEFYFSTVASAFVDWTEVGYPTTYSEVHRFDRTLWKCRNFTRKLYYRCKINFLVSERKYYEFESWYNDVFFKSRFYKINRKLVNAVRDNKTKIIRRNSVLNDYPGYFKLYDIEHVYSVKRIPRDYNDKIRCYIRNLR